MKMHIVSIWYRGRRIALLVPVNEGEPVRVCVKDLLKAGEVNPDCVWIGG